jgi:hypothetical protein
MKLTTAARAVRRAGAAGSAAALLVLAGCAHPPQKTIDATRAALTDVRDGVQGATWAPEEFAAAEASVRQAEDELRRQNGRWGFRRDYGVALELFRAAQADLDLARRAAVAERQIAEKEAREAIDAALASIDHARAVVLVAPVGRDGRSSGGSVDGRLTEAVDRLDEARRLMSEEKYHEALQAAESVQEEVYVLLRAVGRSRRGGL